MTTEPIIEVKNIGKRYDIMHERGRYVTLRDVMTNVLKSPFSFIKSKAKKAVGLEKKEEFWALKDISFEVLPGEVIGIIGANGAGKSTLLKILTGITPPTTGEAIMRGKVSSLLEVGTGFHQELTGRENIFLNGAILGMTRKEIAQKFDEIVEFSGIEKFLDTPVKRYSSGMQVRLAFSVAAHMEPDILIVDEVLAVGDAEFQKKCMGKMEEVTTKDGRTILFVSHNMAAIQQLCNRTVLLEQGKKVADGETALVIQKYTEGLRAESTTLLENRNRKGRGSVRFTRVEFEDTNGDLVNHGISGQSLTIALTYESKNAEPLRYPYRIGVAFYDSVGQVLFNCATEVTSVETADLSPKGTVRCVIPKLPLSKSEYLMTLFLEINGEVEDWIQSARTLLVVDGDFFNTGKTYPEGWEGRGVLVPHHWILKNNE